MAVTKQVYTLSPTWTASQMASAFRSAFIDAGLMTEWYSSFTNGANENRILEITYDGTKTYGKTYYWFIFRTDGAVVALATRWNATTNQPTGTQYLDYLSGATNTSSFHAQLHPNFGPSTTTVATLTRYSSDATPGHVWFSFKQNFSFGTFHIVGAGSSRQSWVDLDKVVFNGILASNLMVSGLSASIGWSHIFRLRRDILGGHLRGITDQSYYGAQTTFYRNTPWRYAAWGNASNSLSNGNNSYVSTSPAIILPNAFSNTNTGYSSNVNPVYHSLSYCQFLVSTLPTDIGIAFHYVNNTMQHGDKLIVTSGSEEWEIIDRVGNATANDGASPLMLARTI
jgi:hypothetical protein